MVLLYEILHPDHPASAPAYCLPSCGRGRVDDGSIMLGCDFCDSWFHPACLQASLSTDWTTPTIPATPTIPTMLTMRTVLTLLTLRTLLTLLAMLTQAHMPERLPEKDETFICPMCFDAQAAP